MSGNYVWLLNAETAMIFFDRCLQKEAVTEKEKNDVMLGMYKEGLIECLGHTELSKDELAIELSKIGNVLNIGKKDDQSS